MQVNEGNIVRLSYAQVAQHHKEKAERDKQATSATDEDTRKESVPQPKGISLSPVSYINRKIKGLKYHHNSSS